MDLGTGCYAAERCEEVAQRATTVLERLADLPTDASPHFPAVQVAALLLRLCCTGKVTHLLRSNPPATVQAAASVYDAALLTADEKLTRLGPLMPEQEVQRRLPMRFGGRGLRSQRNLAPAAWVASWAQCPHEALNRSGLDTLEDLETSEPPLAAACRDALAVLPIAETNGRDDADVPPWREAAVQPTTELQERLSSRLDKMNHASLLYPLDAEGRAHLRPCGGPFAAGWQPAAPAAPAERLDDVEYCSTARELLRQAVAPTGATCSNKLRTGDRAGERRGVAVCSRAYHSRNCVIGGGLIARSGAVKRVWERIRRECGHAVDTQVHVSAWGRSR